MEWDIVLIKNKKDVPLTFTIKKRCRFNFCPSKIIEIDILKAFIKLEIVECNSKLQGIFKKLEMG